MPFTQATPESQGISSTALLKFVNALDRQIHEMHSLMLVRHGKLVAQGCWKPYEAQRPHMLFSLTKSFTATAVGLAAAEGLLSVEDPVLSFFPDKAPAKPDKNLKAMRLKHLLSMSTGHAEDTTARMTEGGPDWVKNFLSLKVENSPGAPFVYNSGASHMLAVIVQQVTGMKLSQYLRPRLFGPLGIGEVAWETSPQGDETGGWGLSLRTQDIARFGQLYLQKGFWNGKQLIPTDWVVQATSKQVSNGTDPNSDWAQGYGYHFWRSQHNAYRGDGAFGQFCLVMPDQDAVLAMTAGVQDMQSVLNLVWKHLLPACIEEVLPEEPAAQHRLSRKLERLCLPRPESGVGSPVEEQINGRGYQMQPNEAQVVKISFAFNPQHCLVKAETGGQPEQVICGRGAWISGETRLLLSAITPMPVPAMPVLASAAWTAEDTLQLTLRFIETPFYFNIACRFAGDEVRVQPQPNVAFDPNAHVELVGKAV
jgi:CubicO group peptidase (beta-lactamase class C family)